MEFIVVLRQENIYATARFDDEYEAVRVMSALTDKGFSARLLTRPI